MRGREAENVNQTDLHMWGCKTLDNRDGDNIDQARHERSKQHNGRRHPRQNDEYKTAQDAQQNKTNQNKIIRAC